MEIIAKDKHLWSIAMSTIETKNTVFLGMISMAYYKMMSIMFFAKKQTQIVLYACINLLYIANFVQILITCIWENAFKLVHKTFILTNISEFACQKPFKSAKLK